MLWSRPDNKVVPEAMSIEREATVRWCTKYFRFLLNRARPGLIVSLAKPRREIRSPKAVTGAEVSLHEPNCRLCVLQEAAMSGEQAPGIPCAVCGRGLHLGDVVIVSREVPPSWALPVEQTMTAIVSKPVSQGEVGPITTGCGRRHRPCSICWRGYPMAATSNSNRAEPSATRPLPARRGWSQASLRVGRSAPPTSDTTNPSCHSGARGRSR